MEGIADAATSVGAVVWGGDLVRAEQVTVDVTVVGRAARPIRRSGARPGDGVWVSGRLGAPRAAVEAWERGETPASALRERFAHPLPRVRESAWLRTQGATAMIDVSDGLVGDAGHLAAASGVALVIDAGRVPVHSAVPMVPAVPTDRAVEAVEADRSLMMALTGGEEYELLVALPADFDDAAAKSFEDQFDLPLTRVGRVERGAGVTVLRGGKPMPIAGGYSHF
jgi:thiamine-monophosphate kinase